MSAERRRFIAVVAALSVLTAAGTLWLIRLVNPPPRPRFVAAEPRDPAAITTPAPDGTTAAGGPTATEGTRAPSRTAATTRSRTADTPPARRSSPAPRTATKPPPPPPVPKRAIRVGGATLDNENPRTPCVVFANRGLGLPVRVTGVRVSGGDVEISAGDCAEDDNIKRFPVCRTGRTLAPGTGCFAGIRATTGEPGSYTGTVRLGLRARCTSVEPAACDVPELRRAPPTPARPVDITWTDGGRAACFKVPEEGDPSGPFCDG